MDARTGYAKAPDGAHLAYSISGAGPLDALYVASGTISIDSWDDEPHTARYYRRLGAFLRLVRYDMRGVGLSDPLGLRTPETIEGMAGDAYAVLDAIGAQQVALIAEDGGASVALELAATHPERFSALVVINGYACLVADDDSPNGIPRPIIEAFLTQNTDPDERWDLDGADDLALMAPSLQHDLTLREWWTRSSRRGASPATARALVERLVTRGRPGASAGGTGPHARHAFPRQSLHSHRAGAVRRGGHLGREVCRAGECRLRAVG